MQPGRAFNIAGLVCAIVPLILFATAPMIFVLPLRLIMILGIVRYYSSFLMLILGPTATVLGILGQSKGDKKFGSIVIILGAAIFVLGILALSLYAITFA